jgi:hypothetical protein
MRAAWVTSTDALRQRLAQPAQVAAQDETAEMKPYLESFLAHLRLLVGIPFEYLVPDSRLLPDESARFFYVDRSWTDRLVDGVISVGKAGTREQAHHQAHATDVATTLDHSEWQVRSRQRGLGDAVPDSDIDPGVTITGFLLRSAAVSGWPQMEVRAFSEVLPAYPSDQAMEAARLPLLRLERLSPAVLVALFAGVPKLVWLEEPHHGVQFGVKHEAGKVVVFRRERSGQADQTGGPIQVPFRTGGKNVVHVAKLRERLNDAATSDADMPAQTGAAMFALEVLDLPWRQRFQSTGAYPYTAGQGGFSSQFQVAVKAVDLQVLATVERLVRP